MNAEGVRSAEGEWAYGRFRRTYRLAGLLHLLEPRVRRPEQPSPGWSEHHPPGQALEQLDAQVAFQGLDMGGDAGLDVVERRRGLGKAPGGSHQAKGLELGEVRGPCYRKCRIHVSELFV